VVLTDIRKLLITSWWEVEDRLQTRRVRVGELATPAGTQSHYKFYRHFNVDSNGECFRVSYGYYNTNISPLIQVKAIYRSLSLKDKRIMRSNCSLNPKSLDDLQETLATLQLTTAYCGELVTLIRQPVREMLRNVMEHLDDSEDSCNGERRNLREPRARKAGLQQEILNECKILFGSSKDTPENRIAVRQVARVRLEALRKKENLSTLRAATICEIVDYCELMTFVHTRQKVATTLLHREIMKPSRFGGRRQRAMDDRKNWREWFLSWFYNDMEIYEVQQRDNAAFFPGDAYNESGGPGITETGALLEWMGDQEHEALRDKMRSDVKDRHNPKPIAEEKAPTPKKVSKSDATPPDDVTESEKGSTTLRQPTAETVRRSRKRGRGTTSGSRD
jgi:hypothetical protein